MTFAEVRRSMDRERFRFARRSSVLGYWHEIKVQLWKHLHDAC